MARVSDAGIGVIFSFFAIFMQPLSAILNSNTLSEFSQQLPWNALQARRYIGQDRDSFTKYVCCPRCHYVYDLSICSIKMSDGTHQSRKCTFVQFPNHPINALRFRHCNTQLMKSVKTSSGSIVLYPKQMFCYKSIIDVLQTDLIFMSSVSSGIIN